MKKEEGIKFLSWNNSREEKHNKEQAKKGALTSLFLYSFSFSHTSFLSPSKTLLTRWKKRSFSFVLFRGPLRMAGEKRDHFCGLCSIVLRGSTSVSLSPHPDDGLGVSRSRFLRLWPGILFADSPAHQKEIKKLTFGSLKKKERMNVCLRKRLKMVKKKAGCCYGKKNTQEEEKECDL